MGAEPLRRPREPRRDRLPARAQSRSRTSSFPGSVTIAEESTAFPAVSRPTWVGGLGFTFKWNMGWMHDILTYARQGPDLPPLGAPAPDVLDALRLERELHPAVLARRGRAREGLDDDEGAGRRVAEGREPARALHLHVRAPRQEAAVHGQRDRPVARVEPRLRRSTGICSMGRFTPGCSASSPISTASTAPSRPSTSWTSSRAGSSGSTATTTSRA